MVVHSYLTKNIDLNPKTIYHFHWNVPSSNLTFQMPNKEKYMTIVAHGQSSMGHLQSYGCIFPPINNPLNNSQTS